MISIFPLRTFHVKKPFSRCACTLNKTTLQYYTIVQGSDFLLFFIEGCYLQGHCVSKAFKCLSWMYPYELRFNRPFIIQHLVVYQSVKCNLFLAFISMRNYVRLYNIYVVHKLSFVQIIFCTKSDLYKKCIIICT